MIFFWSNEMMEYWVMVSQFLSNTPIAYFCSKITEGLNSVDFVVHTE